MASDPEVEEFKQQVAAHDRERRRQAIWLTLGVVLLIAWLVSEIWWRYFLGKHFGLFGLLLD